MSTEKFWSEMGDVRAAMLSIGDARHVPMAPQARRDENAIWFVTAEGTDLATAAAQGPAEASMIVAGDGELHARIEGIAQVVQNRAKLEDLWNPVISAWFDGVDDPDIRLLRLEPKTAEVWASKGSLGFMIQIAKAKITGDNPDAGEHFTVRF